MNLSIDLIKLLLYTRALFELEGWAGYMTLLWNERFDALEKVLEAEKKNVEKNDMERQKS